MRREKYLVYFMKLVLFVFSETDALQRGILIQLTSLILSFITIIQCRIIALIVCFSFVTNFSNSFLAVVQLAKERDGSEMLQHKIKKIKLTLTVCIKIKSG